MEPIITLELTPTELALLYEGYMTLYEDGNFNNPEYENMGEGLVSKFKQLEQDNRLDYDEIVTDTLRDGEWTWH